MQNQIAQWEAHEKVHGNTEPTLDEYIAAARALDARLAATKQEHRSGAQQGKGARLNAVVTKGNGKQGAAETAPTARLAALMAGAEQKRRPLSDVERKELRQAGVCFKCRKPGHIARNCPEKASPPSAESTGQGNTPAQ